MDQAKLTWLGETFDAVRTAREEAQEILDDNRGGRADLMLTAKAAHLLRGLGDISQTDEWEITLRAIYVEGELQHNLTKQEIQDYATTLNRLARELSELEAA